MISHRCRYKARGSVLMRVFTSSSVRWVAARVTLAISSLFSFQSSPPLFYHSTRISITDHEAHVYLLISFIKENDKNLPGICKINCGNWLSPEEFRRRQVEEENDDHSTRTTGRTVKRLPNPSAFAGRERTSQATDQGDD